MNGCDGDEMPINFLQYFRQEWERGEIVQIQLGLGFLIRVWTIACKEQDGIV